MREIKFRAWDDVEERFWTLQDGGEESGDCSVQYFGNEQGVLEIGRLEEFDTGLGVNSQFTAFPLYQYTGLKDKNGREIYEGDFVRRTYESGTTFIGEIVFEEGTYFLRSDEEYSFLASQYRGEVLEVIGNKYANPELLEVAE